MKDWMLMTLKVLRLFSDYFQLRLMSCWDGLVLALVQIMLHDFLMIVLKLSNKKSTQKF